MRTAAASESIEAGSSRRLRELAGAFAAFRRASGPGRRIPEGLRTRAVALLNAGVRKHAIAEACGVSWAQLTRWQGAGVEPAAAARVLSVVDAGPAPSASETIELRVGGWHIRLTRD